VVMVWSQPKKHFAKTGICENIQSLNGNIADVVINSSISGFV